MSQRHLMSPHLAAPKSLKGAFFFFLLCVILFSKQIRKDVPQSRRLLPRESALKRKSLISLKMYLFHTARVLADDSRVEEYSKVGGKEGKRSGCCGCYAQQTCFIGRPLAANNIFSCCVSRCAGSSYGIKKKKKTPTGAHWQTSTWKFARPVKVNKKPKKKKTEPRH